MNENETTGTPVPETTDTPVTPSEATPVVAEEITETTDTPEAVASEVLPVETETQTQAEPAENPANDFMQKYAKWVYSAVAVALVLAVFYGMEQTGKINTGLFSGIEKMVSGNSAVAKVNGNKITQNDFNISVEQIKAGAEAQGVDVESPEVQADIKSQAIDMLVNTELLKQEAATRGIEITDEDVQARYDELVSQVGGEEALTERMKQFDVTESILRRDIKNELTIQTLLDQVFAEKQIAVTDEEVLGLYQNAGGAEAGLPAIEEVREQIEAQVRSSKEQEIVTSFVNELRTNAEVEVLIDN